MISVTGEKTKLMACSNFTGFLSFRHLVYICIFRIILLLRTLYLADMQADSFPEF